MSQLNVDSIKDRVGANQPDIVGVAKAFVNFDGTGTVAIRAGYNVSSITDNGTGKYTVNFTTAMPDTNFGCCITGGSAGSYGTNAYEGQSGVSPSRTTSSVQLETTSNSTVAIVDDPTINVTIFSN